MVPPFFTLVRGHAMCQVFVLHVDVSLVQDLPLSALAAHELHGDWWKQVDSHSLYCEEGGSHRLRGEVEGWQTRNTEGMSGHTTRVTSAFLIKGNEENNDERVNKNREDWLVDKGIIDFLTPASQGEKKRSCMFNQHRGSFLQSSSKFNSLYIKRSENKGIMTKMFLPFCYSKEI